MLSWDWLAQYWSYFLTGAINTIIISLIVVGCGFVLAVLVALAKMSKNSIVSAFASIYVEVLRGTPMLLQILIAYVLIRVEAPFIKVGLYSLDLEVLIPGLVALILNSSAYVSEAIRAGIQSVVAGQIEAAHSLGFTGSQTFSQVIFPQAMRNVLPALGNEFVTIIKDSSLLSVIGVFELMHNTEIIRANTFMPLPPLLVAGMIYFILTFIASRLVKTLEHHFAWG
ncbi:MAG: amino acid ABC transporter permease [Bifidobacteriaceae bacterium]|jgi:His/Glu/Gln/Arg/opine family amino acid ABC transporter permease subunit|nr:amino acid ABC transporter permease [Bifidobacteriaceae bacterium]